MLKFADDLYIEFKNFKEFQQWDAQLQNIWLKKFGLNINVKKTVLMTPSSEGNHLEVVGDEAGIKKWSLKNKKYAIPYGNYNNGKQTFLLTNFKHSELDDIKKKTKGISHIKEIISTHIEGRPGNLYPKVQTIKYSGTQLRLNMME